MSRVILNLAKLSRDCQSKSPSKNAELLRQRADFLSGSDKTIMKMYIEAGCTCRQIADIAGLNESTISRRIRKISARLLDGDYIFCLQHRGRFNKHELRIIKDYFLNSYSLDRTAWRNRTTVYQVKKTIDKVKRLRWLSERNGSAL